MKRTLAYRFWERQVVVLVHTKDSPTDEEWKTYCDDARKWRAQIRGILVLSEGGGPNSVQRGELEVALDRPEAKTAVVTLSRVARGIVTAMSWFTPKIKAFSTLQIPAALEYLEVPPRGHASINAAIKALRTELELPPE
jgi:hypothetical protein